MSLITEVVSEIQEGQVSDFRHQANIRSTLSPLRYGDSIEQRERRIVNSLRITAALKVLPRVLIAGVALWIAKDSFSGPSTEAMSQARGLLADRSTIESELTPDQTAFLGVSLDPLSSADEVIAALPPGGELDDALVASAAIAEINDDLAGLDTDGPDYAWGIIAGAIAVGSLASGANVVSAYREVAQDYNPPGLSD